MRKQILHKLLLILGMGLLGFLFTFGSKPAAAANPNLISFQGKVVNSDGTNVANGTYSFNFVLFDDPSLGSESDGVHDKWHELRKSVPVTNGIFQTELGSATALPDFSQFSALFLGVKFNGDSAGYMTPRIHLDSVPYAKYADNAGALSGLVAGNFVQLAQGLQTDSSTTNASIAINKTGGSANILTLQKSNTNVMVLDNNGFLSLNPAASLTAGQTHLAESFTNASSTGGTVKGFDQQITVSDSLSASTTYAHNISITDNTSLANNNAGINITISGSNTSQNQIGIAVSVNKGVGVQATSTGNSSLGCGGFSNLGTGICGVANGGGTGVFGQFSAGTVSTDISSPYGTAVYGRNTTGGIANNYNVGLKGLARNSTSGTISIGVYGDANNSSGTGKVYGGYFQLQGSGSSGSALFASNNTNSVNILELQDNTSDVFTVGDGGIVTMKPNSYSTSALQFQNPQGSSLFNIDSLRTVNLLLNGDFESGTSNWIARNSTGLARTSTAAQGNWSMDMTTSAAGSGAEYDYNYAASKTYYLSFEARSASGSFSSFAFGHSDDTGTSDIACQTGVTLTTDWQRFTCSWVAGATVSGFRYIYLVQTDSAGRDIFIDSVQLESSDTSSSATAFDPGAIQLNGVIESPVAIANRYDTTHAFQIQSATGTALLTADTINSEVLLQGKNSTASLGSELASGVTCSGTNWVDNGDGTYTHAVGSTSQLNCSPPSSVLAGSNYQVIYTTGYTGYIPNEYIRPYIGGSPGSFEISGEPGTHTQVIGLTSSTTGLYFVPTSDYNGIVSVDSVKQITQSNTVISVNNSDGTTGLEIRSGGSTSNTFIGVGAGSFNIDGHANVAVGESSLYFNTSGTYNTAVGENALLYNTTGNSNTALGHSSLLSNILGIQNNAVGDQALLSNTVGSNNNAFGYSALASNDSGRSNDAFGDEALYSNITGNRNSALGDDALFSNTFGDYNTGLGFEAGYSNTTGSGNTFLGQESGYCDSHNWCTLDNLQNATAIGAFSQAQQSNSIILGGAGADAANVGIGTTSPTNLFSVSPDVYDTGTASVTAGTTAVTGSGTSWTSTGGQKPAAGMEFIFADGTKNTIQSVNNDTSITLSSNATATETGSSYRIHNQAFHVSGNGTIGGYSSSGSSSLALDLQPSNPLLQANNSSQALYIYQTGTGNGLFVEGASTTGSAALAVQTDPGGTGPALEINNSGSGDALLVSNGGGSALRVDSAGSVILGESSSLDSSLIFSNSVGSKTVGFSLQADPASSYTLLLPTTGPAVSQCLETDGTTANQLVFTACATGGSGVTSVAYSTTANANGGSISGSVLTLAKADGSNPGLLSADAQTIGGDKTFNGFVKISGSGTRPGSPTAGTLYYDTGTNQLIQYNGNKWVSSPRGSTFIVAASTSTQAAKDAADYVTTGTDDAAGINSNILGVAPCSTTGCSVYLEEGTYNLGATSLNVPDNTTISGAGAATVLKFANNVGSGTYYAITNSDTTTGTHVNIQNLMMDGNQSNQSAGTFHGIYFNGVGGGSGSSARDGGKITNTVVRNLKNNGIYITSSSNSTLIGNTAQGNGTGIYINGISNTTLTGNTAQGNSSIGISFLNSTYSSLTGNTAQGNTSIGLYVSASSFNTLSGNTAQGNGTGFYIESATNNVLTGNTAQGNTTQGIYLSVSSNNNTITGNIIESNTSYGIALSSSTNNTISANKIHDNGGNTTNNGIYLGSSSQNSITGNDITDNAVANLRCTTNCYSINISDAGSNKNYLSANHFIGDGTHVATINDAGTNTIYANQSLTENGDAGFRNATNSTSAFQIQNAAGYSVLTVDTSSNSAQGQVMLGVASHNNGMLVFANSAGSNTVSLVSQAVNPASSVSIFLPTAGATGTQCLQSTSGSTSTSTTLQFSACGAGATSVSYSATANANGGSISGSILTLAAADGSNPGLVSATGAQTFGGDKTFAGATTFAPTASNVGTTVMQTTGTATSGNVFDIQTANGSSHFFTVSNTAANQGAITLQSIGGSNDLTLDSGSGTIKLGGNSTSLQKSGVAFALDVTNASDSVLSVTNSGAGIASLSVEGDITAGSGRVFKIGSTSGSTLAACGANNYVSSFSATGGLVTGGNCSTIASSNLSDGSNLALLNGANTFAPTANNSGTTVKQTSGTATSGNVFDVQTANGSSHFIQIANSAANEGAVTIQSVGATRDLTIDSASGIVKLGGNSTSLQKSASSFTLDVANAGASTLNISNSNGSNVANLSVSGDISSGSGHVFKVGATSGVSQTACSSGQFFQGQAATGGIITTAGTCTNAVTSVGTFSGGSIANGGSVSGSALTLGAADGTNPGIVTTTGTQTFGGAKIFSGAVTVQSASGITVGTTSNVGQLALFNGANNVVIQGASSTAQYSIILPAAASTAANQCLVSTTASTGTLQWLPCGAGSTRTITLSPEYAGATMSSDGTSNTGTMTSDFCSNTVGSLPNINTSACASGQSHNYYSWTSASGTNNYDVWVKWQAPTDFASLNSFTAYGWRTTSSSSVKVTIFDGPTQCTTTPTDVATGTATWTSASVPNNSCTISAGDVLTLRVKLTAAASEFARAGEITINYQRD